MQTPAQIPSAISILTQSALLTEQRLDSFLSARTDAPARLMEAIRYSLFAGGKRLRPALVIESARACNSAAGAPTGGFRAAEAPTAAPLDSTSVAAAAAGAMELIHTFSLIHDDLPAMDNDDLRRGRPTNHKVFGEATAILAGDGMVLLAFELLADAASGEQLRALVKELARAAGPEGMVGGQTLDMDAEQRALTLPELQEVHRRKTGALLTATCRMGAIAAGASDEQLAALTAFGRHLGLAFQIMDDVLDLTSTPEQMGKATKKDAVRGKNTYPALLGLEASRMAAAEQLSRSLDALAPLGAPAEPLRILARFVVERTN